MSGVYDGDILNAIFKAVRMAVMESSGDGWGWVVSEEYRSYAEAYLEFEKTQEFPYFLGMHDAHVPESVDIDGRMQDGIFFCSPKALNERGVHDNNDMHEIIVYLPGWGINNRMVPSV